MSLTPRKIYSVYFSPTGSSRLAACSVAYALRSKLDADAEDIDLTPPAARSEQYRFDNADTVVMAMPVYAGRLPNKIAPDIARCLHGGGKVKASADGKAFCGIAAASDDAYASVQLSGAVTVKCLAVGARLGR